MNTQVVRQFFVKFSVVKFYENLSTSSLFVLCVETTDGLRYELGEANRRPAGLRTGPVRQTFSATLKKIAAYLEQHKKSVQRDENRYGSSTP